MTRHSVIRFILPTVVTVLALLVSEPALAQMGDTFGGGGDPFAQPEAKLKMLFERGAQIMTWIAGLAILGMAAAALGGRFPWRWAFSIGGALFIVAGAMNIINWLQG